MSKLIRVERSIATYNIIDEDIISDDNIDEIPLNKLLTIVTPKDDDPLLYDGYVLNENQLLEINSHLNNKLVFDFNAFYYVLECAGIYDYNIE
ncbi:MAG TPA: hypothetical protein VK622_13695 [Puia sp.]|nr:hypothetical protein [Puia sp.]